MSAAVGYLVLAGWPIALALGAVVVCTGVRVRRRTEALSRVLHELRRPLQALALGAGTHPANGGPSPLDLAICAVADLDRVVNGEPAPPCRRLVRLRPVIEGCVERWRPAIELSGGGLEIEWNAGAAAVVADPHRLSQALDNLVANAVEHGAPPITVSGGVRERSARIVVADRGGSMRAAARRGRRRGRGLRIVAAVAAEHGGCFALDRRRDATVAVIELPLASLPLPALAASSAA